MPTPLRALVFAAASVAAGSWVGLGQPTSLAGIRPWPAGEIARAEPEPAWAAGPAHPFEPPPPPHHTDPASVPALAPWASLNPQASIDRAWMVAEGPHQGPEDGRRLVTLTFDDGPVPDTTTKVLDLLKRYRVRATFFVIGRYLDGESNRAQRSREVLRRVVDDGHLIGNHTHDHMLLTTATHAEVVDQIDRGAWSIERAVGKRPLLFRPPYGRLDDYGEAAVRARGLELVLWSVEKQDIERDDAHQTFKDIVAQIDQKRGGIVLLHDVHKSSVDVLAELLAYLDERRFDPHQPDRVGYEIVDLPAYFRAVADDPLALASRDPEGRAHAGL
jgi:peptidoglycan-N-acetylglucosamine deacetylase